MGRLKMRDWNYRHLNALWKMRDQAVMESQNTCWTGIVALTSSFMFRGM